MASSAASAPVIHALTSLPARPPTPPREAGHDVDVSLRSVLGRPQPFDPRRSLQTPPSAHSFVSAATGPDSGSNRARKKVEWSGRTDYKDPPDYSDGSRLEKPALLSAPSSGSSKPIKGILKPSPSPSLLSSTLGVQPDGAIFQPTLIEMLESTVKQLAGPDRDSKLDAYMMLARALKTSNNLPDRVALQNKMGLLMQFIQRDITARNENGALDSSLVNHALTLLITFLHFQAIASSISYDFGVFIVDHAIRSFEDPAMPKDVARHLMQVVAFQNFPPKLMTPDRVGRLVAALHNIENHLQGKSIVMSRLHIYKRLIKQARGSMLLHSDWLKDMFADMLSTVRDIRGQAISLGTEAGFALRADKQLFRKAADVFKAADGDETFIDFYIKRLQRMIKDKQAAFAVPQIWSVVILFLRCPLDRWQYYGPWLTLVQDAFNMTDGLTKQEANFAWNRYACLSITDGKITPKSISTLCQPLLSQLRRKTSPKQQEEAFKLRRVVIGGVCSLYYHALAQGDEKCPNELVWDVAVQPVMSQLITLDRNPDIPGDSMMLAARILAGLLDVSTPRPPRNPDRIMDPTPLKPEDLLPIDSKWVRRNCDRIFQAVGPILENKFTDLANKDSIVFRLWQALVGSVAAASAKDIKVSEDTSKFLACALSLLAKLWSRGCAEDDGTARTRFSPSVKHFIQLLADGLGLLPFMEKKLSMSTPVTFETVAPPLQRSGKCEGSWGGSRTPLQHLFAMLSSVPPGCADDEELADLFRAVFEPFLNSRTGKARAELAREFIHLLPPNALSPYGPWVLVAENMKACLDRSPAWSGVDAPHSERPPGPEYLEVVSLLERGLTCHPSLPAAHWKQLFHLVSASVSGEFGDEGRAVILVEPLAKYMLENAVSNSALPSAMSLRAMTMLFHAANLPRDRKALDTARQRLWGAPPAAARMESPDPFDSLYKLANVAMEVLNGKFVELESHAEMEAFVESVASFFERCLPLAPVKTMSKLQHGLCPWIQDDKDQLRLHEQTPISETLSRLVERSSIALSSLGQLERTGFDQIESFLTAALRSKSTFIVNQAARAWNALAKDDEQVECSDNFKSFLSSLRLKVDLFVPGNNLSNDVFDAQVSSAIGRHSAEESIFVLSSAASGHESNQSAPGSSDSKRRTSRKRQLKTTPEASEKPFKRRNTLRPRHEDSQIQFTAIAPSSSPQDESQHLTSRQKEVRERQRENVSLFSEIRPGAVSEQCDTVERTGVAGDPANDATPNRNASFDDLIRSTPTPRRGQVLPMDDSNDPPSSPPDPRPCPLLSEIQSRSRVSNSLDNWEFSSPTGSPVAKLRQAAQESRPAPIIPTARASPRASPPRTRTRSRRQKRPSAMGQEAKRTDASSIVGDDQSVEDYPAGDSAAPPAATDPPATPPPATPPRRRIAPRGIVLGTPNSGEDEFIDARSSPESQWSARHARKARGEEVDAREDTKDVSFALSEGEEHGMIDLVIELESRRHDLPVSETEDSPKMKGGRDGKDKYDTQALPAPSSGPTTRRGSQRLASLATISTPAAGTGTETRGDARRKRKRGGAKFTGSRDKRRRSAEPEGGREESPPVPAQTDARRSFRKRKQRTVGSSGPESAASLEAKGSKGTKDDGPSRKTEAEDTDDEVMSQLVTESIAASQQSEYRDSPLTTNRATRRSTRQRPDEEARGGKAGRGEDDAAGIMGTLRSGLEQLRKLALTRDRVYELEDMLMDMKSELYQAEKRGRQGSK